MGGDGWKEIRLAGPLGAAPAVLRSCSRTLCMIRLGFGKILSSDGGKWKSRQDRSAVRKHCYSGAQPKEGRHSENR